MGKSVGKGTQLLLSISSVFTAIANLTEVDGPDGSVGTVEATDMESDAKEYLPTIPDGGDVSGKVLYDPEETTHEKLQELHDTPSVEAWKIAHANSGASTNAFSGILTKFKPTGMTIEGVLSADITIKKTGKSTYTA